MYYNNMWTHLLKQQYLRASEITILRLPMTAAMKLKDAYSVEGKFLL